MPKSYAAFISYAHRYKAWVGILQSNLEACLRAAGAESPQIILDQTELASGRSWVSQLQEGVATAEHLILIATPEALASPRVEDDWKGFVTTRRNWAKGPFHVVMLVDVPLPPFLEQIHRLDFVDHTEASYRQQLSKLAGALMKRGPRDDVALPADLEVPAPPADILPADLRRRLVAWLAPLVRKKSLRPTVAEALGIKRELMEGYPTPEMAASAGLVESTGDDQHVKAARAHGAGPERGFRRGRTRPRP